MNEGFYASKDSLLDWSADQHSPKNRDFLRTDELLSWIAYRKSFQALWWPSALFKLERVWRFPDIFGLRKDYFDPQITFSCYERDTYWSKGEKLLARLLTSLSENLNWKDWQEEDPFLQRTGMTGSDVATYLETLTSCTSVDPSKLKEELTSDMTAQRAGFELIHRAAGELRRRLFAGELRCWGKTEFSSSPPVEIQKDFWIPGTITPYDGIVTRDGVFAGVYNLTFETAEALHVWSEPTHANGIIELPKSSPSDTLRPKGGRGRHDAFLTLFASLLGWQILIVYQNLRIFRNAWRIGWMKHF